MHKRTRQFIQETLLTTRELTALIGVPEVTLKKRYERDNSLAVLKGNNLLWDRRDYMPNAPGEPGAGEQARNAGEQQEEQKAETQM